jgi:nucleotide-binding universal stress UspA family protein
VKKILVATDYSKEARNALLFAMDMACRGQAEIVLFHAFHQRLSVAHMDHLEEAISDLEKEKTSLLEDYAREIKLESCQDFILRFHCCREVMVKERDPGKVVKTGYHVLETDPVTDRAGVKITCVSKFGLAADAILVAAQAYGADLVVMGMRGAGPVSQAFWGSTVAGVIQAGKVPVLALPAQAVFKQPPTFVLALDLAALPDADQLGRLHRYIKLFGAKLKVLHLYRGTDPQQAHQQALPALAALDKELYDISYEVHFQQREEIARGIQDFLQTHQADLLALVPKPHTFLDILRQHTFTGLMTQKSTVPLLALPYTPAARQAVTTGKQKSRHLSGVPGK